MSIEVALLVSIVSVAFALYSGIKNLKRNDSKDVEEDAKQMGTILSELKTINQGIVDIKKEMTDVKNDVKADRDRITRLEESLKQAHKRIDEILNRIEKKEGR